MLVAIIFSFSTMFSTYSKKNSIFLILATSNVLVVNASNIDKSTFPVLDKEIKEFSPSLNNFFEILQTLIEFYSRCKHSVTKTYASGHQTFACAMKFQ